MRTTVRLDDDLLRQTKTLAAQTGRTLTAVIEDALRETLARDRGRRARPRAALQARIDYFYGVNQRWR